MKLIKSYIELEHHLPYDEMIQVIENAARTCYKSEDKIKEGSGINLIKKCIKKNHDSVLEHCNIGVRIICDRGVSHELVRHRIGVAFSQESTRYVKYKSNDITFIEPWWWGDITHGNNLFDAQRVFLNTLQDCEIGYTNMILLGFPPEAARAVLPNALKTEVFTTANIREWRHILKLRTSVKAHPDIIYVMNLIKEKFIKNFPVFFEDL